MQLNVVLHCHDLPGYISISKWKKNINCAGLICFILITLVIQWFCFPYVLLSLKNCWFVYLIFQEKICKVYKKNYVPITSLWYDFNSQICDLFYLSIGVALKFIMIFSKWLSKVTLLMLSFSKQSVPSNYWGQCGKNHLLEADKTITCNPLLALWSSMRL